MSRSWLRYTGSKKEKRSIEKSWRRIRRRKKWVIRGDEREEASNGRRDTVSSLAGEWLEAVSKVVSLSLSQNGPFTKNQLFVVFEKYEKYWKCDISWKIMEVPLVALSVGRKYRMSIVRRGSSRILKYIYFLILWSEWEWKPIWK